MTIYSDRIVQLKMKVCLLFRWKYFVLSFVITKELIYAVIEPDGEAVHKNNQHTWALIRTWLMLSYSNEQELIQSDRADLICWRAH